MKTLIIIANPSKTSFSHAMADAYSKKCEDFEVLDLYDIHQGYLTYESTDALKKGEVKDSKIIKEIQKKITACDEMVFFFPVWWGGVPAILKNFFDSNFSAGFAFNFEKNGKIQKLLMGKTAKIFCTCDAPGFIYKIPFFVGINLKKFLRKTIFSFCGIKMTEFNLFDAFHSGSEDKKKIILESILK